MIRELNATESALGDILAIRRQRATDANDGEQACIGVLDGLLHVLANVTHPSWLRAQGLGQWAAPHWPKCVPRRSPRVQW
jgi:hypothetical protein